MHPRKSPNKTEATTRGEDRGTAEFIQRLADRDPAVRERAAKEIFRRGFERAERSAREWLRDGELAACFVAEDSGFPRTTVGLAVNPSTFERIRAANGTPSLANVPPDFDAKEFELVFAGGVRLDVLTTRDAGGDNAIARFVRKYGEGIQQVELSVRSVNRAAELLRGKFGVTPIYSESRTGADATRVNFFLVAAGESEKLLIELVEAPTTAP